MYRLHFHEDLGYLEAELAGFWTLDELYAFDREMQAMVMRYAPRFPSFPLLSDSRNHGVQSTEVSDAFAACSTAAAKKHQGHVAIVVSGMLARMQSQRIVDTKWTRRFFMDVDEARAWIEEEARALAELRRSA